MRCAACGRNLLTAAYIAPSSQGGYALGPVCYQRAIEAGTIQRPTHDETRGMFYKASEKLKRKRAASRRVNNVQLEIDYFCASSGIMRVNQKQPESD